MIDNIYYIDITSCPNAYFSEAEYCNVLMNASNVKTVLFTNADLTNLKDNTTNLNQTMLDFINYINYEPVAGYRLIIEFNDNTFATLKI